MGSAQAATIFADDFDGETPELNASLDNFDVTGGTVDVVGTGFFDFYPGNGNYVDLDGSTRNAGRIATKDEFAVTAGQTYSLSFEYGRNRGQSTGTELLTFGFGGFTESLVVASYALQEATYVFTATTSGLSRLFFEAAGGDFFGPSVDEIELATVVAPIPVPAGGLLLASAIGALGFWRRRR